MVAVASGDTVELDLRRPSALAAADVPAALNSNPHELTPEEAATRRARVGCADTPGQCLRVLWRSMNWLSSSVCMTASPEIASRQTIFAHNWLFARVDTLLTGRRSPRRSDMRLW